MTPDEWADLTIHGKPSEWAYNTGVKLTNQIRGRLPSSPARSMREKTKTNTKYNLVGRYHIVFYGKASPRHNENAHTNNP